MDTRITIAWNNRREMYAESSKLYAKGAKLYAEGDKLYTESDKLYTESDKLCAEGEKLRVEGDKLRVESNKLYVEGAKLRAEGNIELLTAIIAVYGDITIIDRFYDGTTPWVLEGGIVIGEAPPVLDAVKQL